MVKQYTAYLAYQQTQPQEKALHYEIPCRPWEVVGADVFMTNCKTLLCIVDYHSKFPIVKKVNSLSADDVVHTTKLIFAECGFLRKTVSDVGTTFTSETFKDFCRKMNIQQIITSSYHYDSNGQVEVCIIFIKHTIKNALILRDIHLALLKIHSMAKGADP